MTLIPEKRDHGSALAAERKVSTDFAACTGVGLKPQHVPAIISERPEIGFFEIHAENYMGRGGAPHRHLAAIRERYPVSVHGVGLSLGGALDLDEAHLDRLAALIRRCEPTMVSEHLAWSSATAGFLNDLLPVPYTHASLDRVVEHVDRVQNVLGRRILLENPSTYVGFEESDLDEVDYIAELAKRSGCGLLLDVNNVFVSTVNHGRDAHSYIARFPVNRVEEIHLGGHSARIDADGASFLIDSHDRAIAAAVWELYRFAIALTGPVPTLVERDANIPPLKELLAEATHAQACMEDIWGAYLAVAC